MLGVSDTSGSNCSYHLGEEPTLGSPRVSGETGSHITQGCRGPLGVPPFQVLEAREWREVSLPRVLRWALCHPQAPVPDQIKAPLR